MTHRGKRGEALIEASRRLSVLSCSVVFFIRRRETCLHRFGHLRLRALPTKTAETSPQNIGQCNAGTAAVAKMLPCSLAGCKRQIVRDNLTGAWTTSPQTKSSPGQSTDWWAPLCSCCSGEGSTGGLQPNVYQ